MVSDILIAVAVISGPGFGRGGGSENNLEYRSRFAVGESLFNDISPALSSQWPRKRPVDLTCGRKEVRNDDEVQKSFEEL